MAVKTIRKIGKPLNRGFAYKYREAVEQKAGQEVGRAVNLQDYTNSERNQFFQLSQIDRMRTNFRNEWDKSFAHSKSDDPTYQLNLEEHGKKAADTEFRKVRQKAGDDYDRANREFDARETDIKRSVRFGTLKSVYQSFATGLEMLAAPGRIVFQGEESAMAYQEAARLASFHVPDGPVDKYLNLAAANAIPMGTTIAAHMVPGAGTVLGSALMSTYMGSDMYLNMRREGVPQDRAAATAVMGGLALGYVEYATGSLLQGTLGRVPVAGKLLGSASRAERLKSLTAITGAKGGLNKLYRTMRAGGANLTEINKALMAAFGSSSGKAGVLADLVRQGGTEALTGGVEEWIQSGLEMAMVEKALLDSGLEGIMPRREDGSIDGGKVLEIMNDSFIAGAILEGAIGGGIGLKSLGSRMNTASAIGTVKNMLNGEVLSTADGTAFPSNELSDSSKDYLARRILTSVIIAEQKAKAKGKELTIGQRKKVIEAAKKEAVTSLADNPIEALYVNYANAEIESVKEGEMLILNVGGRKMAVVKSKGLPKTSTGEESGAMLINDSEGKETYGVSEEVWSEIEKRGLGKDVIAINMFRGSTLAHEVMHVVDKNLPAAQRDAHLSMYSNEAMGLTEQAEKIRPDNIERRMESAATAVEEYTAKKSGQPIRTAFKDAYYRIEVGLRGEAASRQAKESVIGQRVTTGIATGAAIDLPFLTGTDRAASAGRTAVKIGKGAVVVAGKTGKKIVHIGAAAVEKITKPKDLSQAKKVSRGDAVQAYKDYQTEDATLNDKLQKYMTAYAEKKDLAPEEIQKHQNFLDNLIQQLTETDTIATGNKTRQALIKEHASAINEIKRHTGRMRGFAKRMAPYSGVYSKSRQANAQKFLTGLAALAREGGSQAEWTSEMQAKYEALLEDAQKEQPLDSTLVDQDESIAIRNYLNGPKFTEIRDIVADAIGKQNAKAIEKANISKTTTANQIFEETSAQDQAFAEEIASSDVSSKVIPVQVGTPTLAGSPRFDLLSTVGMTTMFPLTEEAYNEIFSRIVRETSLIDTVSGIESKSTFDQGLLSIGGILFDTTNYTDRQKMDDLTKIYGPMWAIALEIDQYIKTPEVTEVVEAVNETLRNPLYGLNVPLRKRLGNEVEYVPRPNILRAVSAFITVASQSIGTLSPMQVFGTGVTIQQQAQVIADDLVKWFHENAGLPTDGSPIAFADLGGQWRGINQQQMLKDEGARKLLGEGSGSMIRADINEGITAEAAARAFIREFVELFHPALSEKKGDLKKPIYQEVVSKEKQAAQKRLRRIGKRVRTAAEDAGMHISPQLIAERGLSRQAVGGPLAEFLTMGVQDAIGELLNRISDRYAIAEQMSESGELSDTAARAGVLFSKMVESATKAGFIGDIAEDAPTGEKLKALGSLDAALDKVAGIVFPPNTSDSILEAVTTMEAYLIEDPDRTTLQKQYDEANRRLKEGGNLSQAKQKAVPSQMLDYTDAMFGVRNLQEMKVQTDTLPLMKAWNDIFGLETPGKMRELLIPLLKRLHGVVKGKPLVNEQRLLSEQYSLAMNMAMDAMNNPDDLQGAIDDDIAASEAFIKEMESKKDRTKDEDWRLAKHKEYIALQETVEDIVYGRTETGKAVNTYIDQYAKKTKQYYDDMNLKDSGAPEVLFWIPRVYVESIEDLADSENQYSTKSGRELARKDETLANAMRRGEVFKHEDHLVSMTAGMMQTINSQANKAIVRQGLNDGFFSLQSKPGMKMLQADSAKHTTYTVSIDGKPKHFLSYKEAQAAGKNQKPTEVTHDLYAPAEIADHFNKLTKPSSLRKHPFSLGLLAANAKLKGLKIVWGMFHRRAFVWSAMMAGAVTPGMEFAMTDLQDASKAWKKVKNRFNYAEKRDIGRDIMATQGKLFNDLIFFGATGFKIQDIGRSSQQYKTSFEKYLAGESRGEHAKAANKYIKRLSNLTHRFQDELFGIFGTSLKFAVMQDEMLRLYNDHSEQITKEKRKSQRKKQLSKQTLAYRKVYPDRVPKKNNRLEDYHSDTEVEILRSVAGMGNADFGGLHTGRLAYSKTAQDAMRLMFLGPDWTASNILSVLKLHKGKDTGITGVGRAFSGSDIERKIYQQFWLRILARSLMLATTINLLMAGLDDESALQRLKKAKKRKKFRFLMADISPVIQGLGGDKGVDHYLNVPGHFLDPVKMIADPVRMAYHKSSAVAKPVLDAFSGTRYDYKRPTSITQIGKKGLYTWETNKRGPISPSEMPSYLIYQGIQGLPIQFRNLFDIAAGEENFISGALRSAGGLDIQRTYGNQ